MVNREAVISLSEMHHTCAPPRHLAMHVKVLCYARVMHMEMFSGARAQQVHHHLIRFIVQFAFTMLQGRQLVRRFATTTKDRWNCLISETPSGLASPRAFVAKDNFATKEGFTTCGSKILAEYKSPFTARAVELLENAGYVLAGKANMDEFGMGSSTTNSYFGATVNPRYDVDKNPRISGGSSGGSAAAVAGGLAEFALGSDTGGSVRQPASYCGVYGFKPTYGRVSRYGLVAYSQSLDTVGVIARDLDTVDTVFLVIDRYDSQDITSMPQWLRQKIRSDATGVPEKLTIGVPEELLVAELLDDTTDAFSELLARLHHRGHTVVPVSVPAIKKALSAYYTLATAEAASNLARYDGVRYGYTASEGGETGEQVISANRSEGFGSEVQNRILLGNYTLSSESGDHFLRATKVREQLVKELSGVFSQKNHLLTETITNTNGCHVLVSPTAFGEAPTVEEFRAATASNFLNGYINDVLTVPASLAGIPAMSMPMGDGGVGVQVMGQYGQDEMVLAVSREMEKVMYEGDVRR